MAEKLSIEQIRGRLTPVFEKYGVRRAVLFGSYAKGTATAKSDVDLFVDSGLRGLKFTGFLYDIERAAGVRDRRPRRRGRDAAFGGRARAGAYRRRYL